MTCLEQITTPAFTSLHHQLRPLMDLSNRYRRMNEFKDATDHLNCSLDRFNPCWSVFYSSSVFVSLSLAPNHPNDSTCTLFTTLWFTCMTKNRHHYSVWHHRAAITAEKLSALLEKVCIYSQDPRETWINISSSPHGGPHVHSDLPEQRHDGSPRTLRQTHQRHPALLCCALLSKSKHNVKKSPELSFIPYSALSSSRPEIICWVKMCCMTMKRNELTEVAMNRGAAKNSTKTHN